MDRGPHVSLSVIRRRELAESGYLQAFVEKIEVSEASAGGKKVVFKSNVKRKKT